MEQCSTSPGMESLDGLSYVGYMNKRNELNNRLSPIKGMSVFSTYGIKANLGPRPHALGGCEDFRE